MCSPVFSIQSQKNFNRTGKGEKIQIDMQAPNLKYISSLVVQLDASRKGHGWPWLTGTHCSKTDRMQFSSHSSDNENQSIFPLLLISKDLGPTLSKDWQSCLGVWSFRQVENAQILFLNFPVEVPCIPVHHVKSFCITSSNTMWLMLCLRNRSNWQCLI